MNRKTRETIGDTVFVGSILLGITGCLGAGTAVGHYIREKNDKLAAYDVQREPGEDSSCTEIQFDKGQTGRTITESFPHYNQSSNKTDRLYAVVGIASDEVLAQSVTVDFCTVEDTITIDAEVGTSVPGFAWDMFPATIAADETQVTPAEFLELLETNR